MKIFHCYNKISIIFKVMNFYETLCSSGIPLMNLIYDLMALELFNKGMWHIKGTMF